VSLSILAGPGPDQLALKLGEFAQDVSQHRSTLPVPQPTPCSLAVLSMPVSLASVALMARPGVTAVCRLSLQKCDRGQIVVVPDQRLANVLQE
jgi:hypothetical protein